MKILKLLLAIYVLISFICAQAKAFNFDSSLKAAAVIPNDEVRLRALEAMNKYVGEATNPQAISFDETLLATYKKLGKDSNVVVSHINLAYSYCNSNQFDKALSHCFQALPLTERQHNYAKQVEVYLAFATTYKIMARVSHNAADLDMAMNYTDLAMEVSHQNKLIAAEGHVLAVRAILYDMKKQPVKAIDLYRQAIVLSDRAGRHDMSFDYMANLAITLKNNKQYDESLSLYKKVSKYYDSLGNKGYVLLLGDNMAILYQAMGRPKESESLALSVLHDPGLKGMTELRLDLYELLTRVYEDQHQYQEALGYSHRILALKDSLLNKEKNEQLAEMQTRFDTKLKDKQIASQATTLAFNRRQTLYMWMGIALLLITGSVIYASQQRTRRLNKQITAQQAELMIQQKELRQLNDMKDRLFSVISHDLRTPINALLSFTMILDRTNLPPEKLKHYTTILKETLGHTTDLLENLLHFAKSQMQVYKPNLQPVNISGVIHEIVQLMQPSITKKNLQLINRLPADAIAVADADMAALIFRNIISNAVKYSFNDGVITISATVTDHRLLCTIKDEGTGLKPELVAAFNQETDHCKPIDSVEGTHNEKGTGLGLMLCHTFITQMDGHLHMESEVGKGAAITVSLGLYQPALKEA